MGNLRIMQDLMTVETISGFQPFWWSGTPMMYSSGYPCSYISIGELKHTVDRSICITSGGAPGMCSRNPQEFGNYCCRYPIYCLDIISFSSHDDASHGRVGWGRGGRRAPNIFKFGECCSKSSLAARELAAVFSTIFFCFE